MNKSFDQIDVSIIIVNYNTKELLRDCLTSVFDKTKDINYEIIIVDNASSDGSVAMLKKEFSNVKLIESNENLGFGRANNLGAKYANGRYLFLLNTDTLLVNNAIKSLLDTMEADQYEEIGVCGGNLYKNDLTSNYSYSMNYPTLFNIFCYRFHLSSYNNETFNNSEKIKDVAIIIGADMFIRTKVFHKLGGFDPNFFMYVEEGEFQYRIKKNNYKIKSVPQAKIIHLQGASSTNIKRLLMEIKSYSIFFRKHFSPYTIFIYKAIEIMSVTTRAIISLFNFKLKQAHDYIDAINFIIKT